MKNHRNPLIRTLLGTTVALLLAASASSACEGGQKARDNHGPRGPERSILQLSDQLGLTPEQISAIESIETSTRAQMESLHSQLRDRVETLREGSDFSREAVRNDAEVQALREQIRDLRKSTRDQVKATLTDAQIEQMKELHADRRGERLRDRRGNRRGAPPGDVDEI